MGAASLGGLFERKETQEYLDTRRTLDETLAKRNLVERSMKAAVEKQQYREAHEMQAEIERLTGQMAEISESLGEIVATDEHGANVPTINCKTLKNPHLLICKYAQSSLLYVLTKWHNLRFMLASAGFCYL